MGIYVLAFLLLLGGAGVGYMMLWYKLATTQEEVRRLRATQDQLIDLVSDTLIEDSSARDFLKSLKIGRERLGNGT
jgi:hypothetical protein